MLQIVAVEHGAVLPVFRTDKFKAKRIEVIRQTERLAGLHPSRRINQRIRIACSVNVADEQLSFPIDMVIPVDVNRIEPVLVRNNQTAGRNEIEIFKPDYQLVEKRLMVIESIS